ncbi:MAG TPA: hypothetical protein VF591_02215 [Pyrinomonadaceae bacterium]|jgi:hypothetical protein
MPTEIIFALVLAAVFFGAIAWLVIYSRLQHHRADNAEQQHPAVAPAAAPVKPRSSASTRRVVTR